jgi:type VI secretion system protein ImpH
VSIRAIESGGLTAEHATAKVRVAFFGLTGPSGVLPQPYTELEIRRLQRKDSTLRDFLDLFHHRAISLFYRAWRKYRLPFSAEHAARQAGRRGGSEDSFSLALRSLVGRGTVHVGRQRAPELAAWIYYSGLFASTRRSGEALSAMLAEMLGTPVEVMPFVGRWLEIPPSERSRLGQASLGGGLALGDRVWDVQSKTRVVIGPMDQASVQRFAPGSALLRRTVDSIRAFVDRQLDFELDLLLLPGAGVPTRLGGDPRKGSRLGWNAWVSSGDPLRMDRRLPLYLGSGSSG